jgi:hypothetical protein
MFTNSHVRHALLFLVLILGGKNVTLFYFILFYFYLLHVHECFDLHLCLYDVSACQNVITFHTVRGNILNDYIEMFKDNKN